MCEQIECKDIIEKEDIPTYEIPSFIHLVL